MNKFLAFLWFVFANHNHVQADWKPEYLHKNIDSAPLNDPKFKKAKSKVLRFLTNSWCSSEKATLLMDLVALEKPKVCVEIGVYSGSSLLPIVASLKLSKYGKVYAIDAWSNDVAIQYLTPDDPNKPSWEKMNMNEIYNSCIRMIKKWKIGSICKILHSTSQLAANGIGSIDLLHIDGNYSEENSCEDVQLYLPKVKKGGYVLFTNIGWIVNGKLPRIKAFQLLLDSCEIVAIIDDRNSFLVRKLIN